MLQRHLQLFLLFGQCGFLPQCAFHFVEGGQQVGLSTFARYDGQTLAGAGIKDDVTVVGPHGSPNVFSNVSNSDRGTTRDSDLHELPVEPKAERLTVG